MTSVWKYCIYLLEFNAPPKYEYIVHLWSGKLNEADVFRPAKFDTGTCSFKRWSLACRHKCSLNVFLTVHHEFTIH